MDNIWSVHVTHYRYSIFIQRLEEVARQPNEVKDDKTTQAPQSGIEARTGALVVEPETPKEVGL